MNATQVCIYLWVGFFVLWMLWALRTKRTQNREGILSRLSYTIFVVAAYYLIFRYDVSASWLMTRIFPGHSWTAILGVAITAIGLGFAVWARAYLGGNWSSMVTVKVGHQLIRTGPYRWVRHPIYLGIIVGSFGTALAINELRGLVAVIVLYISFTIKRNIEEHTMAKVFGAEYQEYRQHTGAIFPGINL
jgi:protein-S-isoprenylcysteine O-methyltransferase Ste14